MDRKASIRHDQNNPTSSLKKVVLRVSGWSSSCQLLVARTGMYVDRCPDARDMMQAASSAFDWVWESSA
jgi:hypothetical protein